MLNDVGSALVVLVIKRTDTLSFVEFHATYETLVEKGRTNTLLADSLQPRASTVAEEGEADLPAS